MNSLNNCQGLCHKCISVDCENHPKNYSRELSYASNFIFNGERLKTLTKMMNSKLKSGLQVMMFEEESEFHAIDYELDDRQRKDRDYAISILDKIHAEWEEKQ